MADKLCRGKSLINDWCQDGGDDDFGNHIGSVIDDGVNESQAEAGEGFQYGRAEGIKAILREKPLCPGAEENSTGNDVHNIAKR